tara:strand:+ start:619 stop:789 length:171 start_codon:yes stop_codon:yes gene_type:complete
MTEKEIELAIQGLFRGASKVRARRYAKRLSTNSNRDLTARIATQIWKEDKKYLKAS